MKELENIKEAFDTLLSNFDEAGIKDNTYKYMPNIKPEFEFEFEFERMDLPQFIQEMFTRIQQTKVRMYWLAQNEGMDSQLVYEKLTVFFNWLKNAETVAKPEHADVIQKAFDTIHSWQTYLADNYPINTSQRIFADSIFTGDDQNPEYKGKN